MMRRSVYGLLWSVVAVAAVAFLMDASGAEATGTERSASGASVSAAASDQAAIDQTQNVTVDGILPKAQTGALRFLAEHPEYDGRGVVVAIFDSGVDPGAAGLQTTTDGKTKIVDLIDGTGSGDVDTSKIVKADGLKLQGLTGRELTVSADWNNADGEYHVGMKSAFDFFPNDLVPRAKQERRQEWERAHRRVETELRREIIAWDAAHPSPTTQQRREREELSERLKQLETLADDSEDPGPLLDCVVFHDGTHWRAVVDTDEDGDLAEESVLTDYRTEQQFGTIAGAVRLNFAVNIYDEGNVLSIVADCNPHGTHVAGIVAGHFPEQPILNGLAPGAQIVSVKIGDTRLDGMETGAGMIRGIDAVLRNHCDLINMSYGEPTSRPDHGRVVELFSELVHEHGVIFVAAAGNSGPALSTVIAPGGTTSAIIGVGAYVSPEMMSAEYSLREQLAGMPYTWSSRGPAYDGALGVDIFAPGGAIAPVPTWTLQGKMQMNGTSMASPNACGGMALLLSGLKAEQIAYSPYSVRRALQNTAQSVKGAEVFAQGPGLLQVDRAYEHLRFSASAIGELQEIAVRVSQRGGAPGVYLRESHETRHAGDFDVTVQPVFEDAADKRLLIDYEIPLTLKSSQPWIQVGSELFLTHGKQRFQMHVDPTSLAPGAHFGEVSGYDAANEGRGPLFRVPVTVIRTIDVGDEAAPIHLQKTFEPGAVSRQFVNVPEGATWGALRLRLHDADSSRKFVLQTQQVVPETRHQDTQKQTYVTLTPDVWLTRTFSVSPGRTLEVCLSQYWSSLGSSNVESELVFHGLSSNQQTVTLTAGATTVPWEVASRLRTESFAPNLKLTTLRKVLRPTDAAIRPLTTERDLLPKDRQIHELVLTYEFEQTQAGKITPHFPATDDLLYESEFGSLLWMLFDSGKHRVAVNDVFADGVSIGKGSHVLKLQLRHSDVSRLERMTDMIMQLDRPLSNSVSLGVSTSRADAVTGKTGGVPSTLDTGERVLLHIVAPTDKQLGSEVEPGDTLLGQITYGDDAGLPQDAHHSAVKTSIEYVVPLRPATKATEATESATKSDADIAKRLEEELLEFQVQQLKKIPFESERDAFDRLAARILEQQPNSLAVLTTRLERLDAEAHRKERLPEVIAAADAVLAQIDRDKLAAHFGTNIDTEDDEAVAVRKMMTEKRDVLVDTLYRKGRALGYMELPKVIEKHPIADPAAHDKAFESNFSELGKWVDTTSKKYFLLHVRRERRRQNFGEALGLLNRYIRSESPNYWYLKKRRDLYEDLGWLFALEREKTRLLVRFPAKLEAF